MPVTITSTPNADAMTPAPRIKIGRWSVAPFTLQTFIVLETLDSPFVRPYETDEHGEIRYVDVKGKDGTEKRIPVPRIPTMTDLAAALWAFVNWDRPDIMLILRDEKALNTAISRLAAEISLADVAQLQRDITATFEDINRSLKDSGVQTEGDGEKKDGTGSSDS